MLNKIITSLPNFVLLIVSLSGIISLQASQLNERQQSLTKQEYLTQEAQEKQELLITGNLPGLGFNNLIGDWLYLKFIQYFGDGPARETIGYLLSPLYFAQISQRDPRFVDAMLKLDTATSIFAGYPETSVKLLNQSIDSIPPGFLSPGIAPYYLPVYKAIDELLFLGNPQAAEQSYRQASQWAKSYPDEDAQRVAANSAGTANFLATNPKSKIPQIGAWTMVLSNNSDPRTVQRALRAIQDLGGAIIPQDDGSVRIRVPPDVE